MRQLRFVGLDADGAVVHCELADSGEKVALPLDDRVRAAVSGSGGAGDPSGSATDSPASTADAAAPAGGADAQESAASAGHERTTPAPSRPVVLPARTAPSAGLRPRDIQDRIRHGATPEEVAGEAGVPVSRIEGFAHPVLLERYTAAERARSAHPVLADGPALDTLEQRVAAAMERKGIDPDVVGWDAWRERKSERWIVLTTWPAGLADDARATWSYTRDSHGGSVEPLDVEAEDLLDPEAAELRALEAVPEPEPARPVSPVGHLPTSGARPGPPVHGVPAPTAPRGGDRLPAPPGGGGVEVPVRPTPPAEIPAPFMVSEPRRPVAERPGGDDGVGERGGLRAREDALDLRRPARGDADRDDRRDAAPTDHTGDAGDDATEDFLQHPPARPEKKSSRRHPTMPSWEDVLLGVRSKDD